MDWLDIVKSDEWKKFRDAMFELWKFYVFAALDSRGVVHLQHQARVEMIERIMRIPIDKLPKQEADLYRHNLTRRQEKILRNEFEGNDA